MKKACLVSVHVCGGAVVLRLARDDAMAFFLFLHEPIFRRYSAFS